MLDEDSISVNSLFLEPPKEHKSFSLRKRKKLQEDSISLNSFCVADEEGPSKRKKRLGKVTSLASLFSTPIRPLQNAKQVLKKSISGMLHSPNVVNSSDLPSDASPTPSLNSLSSSPAVIRKRGSVISLNRLSSSSNLTPYRPPAPTPTKQRIIQLWSETWGKQTAHSLCSQEIKRQEAIYELWHGECDLIEDISMLQRNYHESLVRLGLLNNEEAQKIFGGIETLLPVHIDLRDKLKNAKKSDGSVDSVADILYNWVPKLELYVDHCPFQIEAKTVLDEKRSTDPRVQDFLTRCLESPFSRRLDVWSYLDVPRSRLVKYPLLIKQIQKYTNEDHHDYTSLSKVLDSLSRILARVDHATGLARCKQAISQIDVTEDPHCVLSRAANLVCEGPLKTAQGLKLQCFLFDTGLVLTRLQTTNRYSLFKPPFEARSLSVSDLGSKVGRSNSFLPSSSSGGVASKYVFKVETPTDNVTLLTHNEHNKKQWMQGLKKAMEECKESPKCASGKDLSDLDSGKNVPKIKATFNIHGTHRGKILPRGKLQVVSAPELNPTKIRKKVAPATRLLRSKGTVCITQTLSPETHRICTRSCTSLKYAAITMH